MHDRSHPVHAVVGLSPLDRGTPRASKWMRSIQTGGISTHYIGLNRAGRFAASKFSGPFQFDSVCGDHIKVPGAKNERAWRQPAVRLVATAVGIVRLALKLRQLNPTSITVLSPSLLPAVLLVRKIARNTSPLHIDCREPALPFHFSGSLSRLTSRAELASLRKSSKGPHILTITATAQESGYRELGFNNIFIVPNFPTLEDFPSDDLSLVHATSPAFSVVGSQFPGRSTEDAIAAVGLLTKRNVEARLEITGDGDPEYLSFLASVARSHDVENRVKFLGRCERDEVQERYLRCHCSIVLLDRKDAVNSLLVPNKLFEATAAGRPMLVRHNTETQRHSDKRSYIFDAGDSPDSLANSMQTFTEDVLAKDYEVRCDAAREDFLTDLNWQSAAGDVVSILAGTAVSTKRSPSST